MENNQEIFMLTTYDNPVDPFENFELWWKTDMRLGHNCCGVLAENALTSEIYSEEINNKIIEDAANDLIRREPTLYRKVYQKEKTQIA